MSNIYSTRRLSQDEFIKRVTKIHQNRLDFSNTIYRNTRSPVIVKCVEHGDFSINTRSLLNGVGCKQCNHNWNSYVHRQRASQSDWIKKAQDKHNGFYDYSKVQYMNSRTPVCIICPIHGEFTQQAGGHLEGYGCRKCGDTRHGDYRPWFIKTYFDRFPHKKDIPAILYLLYNKDENFYKVGITTLPTVTDRIKYMGYDFEIIDYVKDSMYNVAMAEQNILRNSVRYKPQHRFGGYSECLTQSVNLRDWITPGGVGNPVEEGRQT